MNSAVLDVAVGVAFMCLLLSLLLITVQEGIATVLQWRAKTLFRSIQDMIGKGHARRVLEHPLLRNLSRGPLGFDGDRPRLFANGLPSYIPSRTFVVALLDVLRGEAKLGTATGITQVLANAEQVVEHVSDPSLKAALRLLVSDAKATRERLDEQAELVSQRLETWFNDRMDRTSGWYKRKAQYLTYGLALAMAVATNADSIYVVQRLWSDSALRASVAASAESFQLAQAVPAEPGAALEPGPLSGQFQARASELAGAGLPIGWSLREGSLCARPQSPGSSQCWAPTWFDRFCLVLGWLTTALALSLGSTFWFDALKRLVNLRGSGPRVLAAVSREPAATRPGDQEAPLGTVSGIR